MSSDGEQEEGGSTQDGEESGVSGNIFEESQQGLLMSRKGVRKSMGKARMMPKRSIGGSIGCDRVPQVPHL